MPLGLSSDKELPECRDRAQELAGQELFTPQCWLGGQKNIQGRADNRAIKAKGAAGPSKARKQLVALDEEVCVKNFIPPPWGRPLAHACGIPHGTGATQGRSCTEKGAKGWEEGEWSSRRQGKQSHMLKEICSNRSPPRVVPVGAQPLIRDFGCWEGTRVSLGPGLGAVIPTGTTMYLSLAHFISFDNSSAFFAWSFSPSYLLPSDWS